MDTKRWSFEIIFGENKKMSTIKKMLTNTRVIIWLIVLILSIVAINPSFDNEGVTIRSIVKDSPAHAAGIKSPDAKLTPLSKEKIISINNQPIKNEQDYYEFVRLLSYNQTITIRTDSSVYPLTTSADNPTELGIRITNAPTSNIRKGLDLEGGTRVLLKPQEQIDDIQMASLIDNMKQRLNVYGLSDLVIREVDQRAGLVGDVEKFILIEIAGVTEQEVKDLVSSQGKFEAKISNKTAFSGGDDIRDVCRRAECSGIDPMSGCFPVSEGYACRFRFSITLSTDAAKNQADLTRDLDVVVDGNDEYLSESIELYLDDGLVDTLRIGADLKGVAATDISISGSGVGRNEGEALQDALSSMKKLQTVLITGSLPVKLDIIKIDTLSPTLGRDFVKNMVHVGIYAILAVAIVLFIRYRKIAVSIPIAITMVSEIVIMLGVAAMIGWNLDLAAIAGILIAAGTGVDDQVVITDETLKGENLAYTNWKQRLKKAFFIIIAAYFTTVVAMIPLLFAGAGLLKGFALTTIIGVSIGVLITRPAYAAVAEILLNK